MKSFLLIVSCDLIEVTCYPSVMYVMERKIVQEDKIKNEKNGCQNSPYRDPRIYE